MFTKSIDGILRAKNILQEWELWKMALVSQTQSLRNRRRVIPVEFYECHEEYER